MKAALLLLCLPAIAAAGIDQPWNEPNDGGGRLPLASVLIGLAGAAYAAYEAVRHGDSAGKIFFSAWLGLVSGMAVGLPVSCVLN